MANNLSFTISAVDKATATVARINRSVDTMTRPWTNLSRSIGKFNKASGLDKVGAQMSRAAKSAGALAGKVSLIAAPLAALVGGGTIAGLYEMATAWAKLGAETDRTAQILGVSAQDLDRMRNSGRLMGVTAEAMTTSFTAFADTLQDAKFGRNMPALAMLQYMGIQLESIHGKGINAQKAMIAFADKVQKVQGNDPAAARKMTQIFGVEALLPVLMKGGNAMKAYQAEAARLSGTKTPEMIARADAIALSVNKMGLAIDGAKMSISDRLIPVLDPLITKWTEWIVLNKDWIGQNIADVVDSIGKAISEIDMKELMADFKSFAKWCVDLTKGADGFIKAVGGWKPILVAIGAVIMASMVTPILALAAALGPVGALIAGIVGIGAWAINKADYDADQRYKTGGDRAVPAEGAYRSQSRPASEADKRSAANAIPRFMEMGWTKAQASGIVASIARESGFASGAIGDNGRAYGLAQLHPDRQAMFAKVMGKPIQESTADEQMRFIDWELRNTEKKAGDALRASKTAYEAGSIVSSLYERPADRDGEAARRGALAEAFNSQPLVVNVKTTVAKDGSSRTSVTTPTGGRVSMTGPEGSYD